MSSNTDLLDINRVRYTEILSKIQEADARRRADTAKEDLRALNFRRLAVFGKDVEPLKTLHTRQVSEALPPERPVINWLVNKDNHGWAYGNNAQRLMGELTDYDHLFDEDGAETDISLAFDIKIARMVTAKSKRRVVRVGGMRPINSLFGKPVDKAKLHEALSDFDAIIVLNKELMTLFSEVHRNVSLIPNGIDTKAWKPVDSPKPGRFVVGFAGSIVNAKERKIKGYDELVEACRIAEIPLVTTTKGDSQLPNDQMRSGFYKKIDLLVHPVAPGKEGCSNVLTEAMSLGVPVLTTVHCGYHHDFDASDTGLFFTERDPQKMAERILALREDVEARIRSRKRGRKFVEQHQDLKVVSKAYRAVFQSLYEPDKADEQNSEIMRARALGKKVVQFTPYWLPASQAATGRLRNLQPAQYLAKYSDRYHSICQVDISIDGVDIYLMSQLISDDNLSSAIKCSDRTFIIYDICDDYLSDTRTLGTFVGQDRADQLLNLADLVFVPSTRMKERVNRRFPMLPVRVIGDGIDYDLGEGLEEMLAAPPAFEPDTVVWFGNPGRGNFESALPLFDAVIASPRHKLRLITKASFINANFPDYKEYVESWSEATFVERLRTGIVSLISHAADAQYKSPNRMLTSLAAGTPAIVWNSASCEHLATDMGLRDLCVCGEPEELLQRVDEMADTETRREVLTKAAHYIDTHLSARRIGEIYAAELNRYTYGKSAGTAPRPSSILFVTHNLESSEGAPRSLMELAQGLRERYHHDVVVLSFVYGKLSGEYRTRGIRLIISDMAQSARDLNDLYEQGRFDAAVEEIRAVINRVHADFCILNTAKTLPLAAEIQHEVPTLCIVRESSDEHVDMTVLEEPLRSKALSYFKDGSVGFVADSTRALWTSKHEMPRNRVIPNGINPSKFRSAMELTKEQAKQSLGLSPDTLTFLTLGTTNRRKNQMEVIEAFTAANTAAGNEAHLFVVGIMPNEYTSNLKKMVEEMPAETKEKIHLVPATPQTGPYLRAADAHIFASLNESYPRVIVEGLIFGVPQLAYKTFGVAEQVRDGVDGKFVEIGDLKGLSDAIYRFITDGDWRQYLLTNAKESSALLEDYNTMLLAYTTYCRTIAEEHALRIHT